MPLGSSVSGATIWSITYICQLCSQSHQTMLLESSVMLLENIYIAGVTHDESHMPICQFIVQAIVIIAIKLSMIL